MTYANLIRTYAGYRTLSEAVSGLSTLTIRTDLTYGGGHGYWSGSPVWEVPSQPGAITPEVAALCQVVERDISDPIPRLFDAVMRSIEAAWQPGMFHLVFHSSGWDTRIISGAIKRLVQKYGSGWLGAGLLFLCNRWEADRFLKVMRAMGWAQDQYVAYTEGSDEEHFARPAYDMGRCAPFPRPGNFFWYLQEWAERNGLMPDENVQIFTGLWANEVWQWFVSENDRWPGLVDKSYGWHMIASMPTRTQPVEYPMVALPVLDILRRVQMADGADGNGLRRAVAQYANPESKDIKPYGFSDGYHSLSERLQRELDDYYCQTEFGRRVTWQVPAHSGNSGEWARWSMALLTQKLIDRGAEIEWIDRKGWRAKQANERLIA